MRPELLSRIERKVAAAAALGVIVLGIAVLAAHLGDSGRSMLGAFGMPRMKANSAAGFVVAGTCLLLRTIRSAPPRVSHVGTALGAAVFVLGVVTLGEYAFDLDLGIDQILVADPRPSAHPGRMGSNTAACFALVGITSMVSHRGLALRLGQVALLGILAIVLLALTGYAYSLAALYGPGTHTPMALNTSLGFAVLGVGWVAVAPTQGLFALASSPGAGGSLMRRLFPAVVLVPIGLGLVGMLALRADFFAADAAVAMFAVSTVVVMAAMLWTGASSVDRAHRDRLQVEEALLAQAAVQRAGDRAQMIVDTAHDAFVSIDASGRIVAWNPQAEAVFGWPRDHALGRSLAETVIPEAYREAHTRGLERYLRTGEASVLGRRIEFVALRRDGTEIPVELTISAARVEGEILFDAFVRDISERRHAEAALLESEERIQAQKRILESVVQGMGEGLVVADHTGKVILVNPAAQEIIGADSSTIEERRGEMQLFHADRRTSFARDQLPLSRALRGEESNDVEIFARRPGEKDGSLILATGRPLTDAQGTIKAGIVVFRDITARRNQEERRLREITTLNELGELLQACQTADEAYEFLGKKAEQLFPHTSGAVFMVEPSKRMVELALAWGTGDLVPDRGIFAIEDCWALRRGQVHYVREAEAAVRCKHFFEDSDFATACIPITAGTESLGVLVLGVDPDAVDAPVDIDQDRLGLATALARQAGLALANLRLRETLRSQSIRDPLTGLFNRRYMEEALSQQIFRFERTREPIGVIMIDVDHFKRFNDTFGHEGGDAVLSALGAMIRSTVRKGDIPCRYGGEELTVILPGASLEESRRRAESLLEGARGLRVRHLGELLGSITISAGVSAYPDGGKAPAELLRGADEALYRAKRGGRDRVELARPLAADDHDRAGGAVNVP